MPPPHSILNSLLPAVKELLDIVVGILFGATPSQMSLLFFLHYLHCAGGWSVIVDPDAKGYAQEWRIEVKTVYKFSKFVLFMMSQDRWQKLYRVNYLRPYVPYFSKFLQDCSCNFQR